MEMKKSAVVTIAILSAASLLAAVPQVLRGQDGQSKAAAAAANLSEPTKTIRMAADALDIIRWSDIGAGNVRLPGVDVAKSMEFWATGTSSMNGQPVMIEYHAALSYNPPAMRVEETRTGAHTFQVVREKYAWDESELGGGLIPGKGTATPMEKASKERMLELWILPYGVVKAAYAAGDQTKASTTDGTRALTYPLSGELSGVTVTATLDDKGFVTKVATMSSDAALNMEAEYSGYADHGDIPTDVKSPGHITEKRNGKPLLDLQIKKWDANNPYLVFPVPETVKKSES